MDESCESWIARRAAHASREGEEATRAGMPLGIAAKLWPTATSSDATGSKRHGYMIRGHSGTTLNDAIDAWANTVHPKWPTPMARDRKGAGCNGATPTLEAAARALSGSPLRPSIATPGAAAGSPAGFLNPSFVEALMGFPIGWTVLQRWETLSFLPLLNASGSPSGEPSKEEQPMNEVLEHLARDLASTSEIVEQQTGRGAVVLGYMITVVIADPAGPVRVAHSSVTTEEHRELVAHEITTKTIEAFPEQAIDEEE